MASLATSALRLQSNSLCKSILTSASLTHFKCHPPCSTYCNFRPRIVQLRGLLHHSFSRTRAGQEPGDASGEEPPETLFTKELKRRGITPASILEENDKNSPGYTSTETKVRENDKRDPRMRNGGIFTGVDDDKQVDQRALSMAMNSEGLEGLIPRAKVLLTLGASFFLAFWPFMLAIVAFSLALYIYVGPSFIHPGSKQMTQPTYVDPYKLLEDERFT
eukprot:TRINITY_DN10067_c0_g1_i1.p1 TRINITY_DN10067_c0_g1~~TRINITY_DN10067_c0_g1_i1.p1  ORF type:complete len:219 (-),score=36.46 TRINITY_DN10067_c0_g1_i1:490-1146(-)